MNLADLQKIENTAQPTAGMGLVLDVNGRLPQAVLQTLPGYQIDYVEYTSSVSITATTEGTANTVVTSTATVFDGATPIIIEFYTAAATAGTGQIVFYLFEDGSSIGSMGGHNSGGKFLPFRGSRRLTPATGSRTYSVRASVDAGTGTAGAGAGGSGATVPGYIRLTRA